MAKFIQLVGVFLLSSFSIFGQNKAPIQPIPPGISSVNFRVGCSLFTDPVNYTTGSTFSYNAPVNNSSNLTGGNGVRYGCLYSVPNQAWFIITVNTGGNLHFNFTNSNNRDIDAAVWGPISGNDEANACASTQNYPLSCDYDAYKPDLYINGAVAGQKYVMLVTNYSNVNTVINISQPTGGSVTYTMVNLPNCALVPTAEIHGTSTTVQEGESATLDLAFTGDSPWNYTLSDGTMGTSITSPLSLNVYPTASQTYTVNSVSNLCGTTGGSGSVGVSVTRDVELKSCFPLNGDALDSKSLNSGTLQNGVTSVDNRLSEANGAMSFDGIDDYISLPASQLNNNTFAFAAWVKLDELPNAINSERVAFSVGETVDEHYISAVFSNGVPYWRFSSNGNDVYSSAIVDLNWHLLTAVRTGGRIKIFVDGTLTGTQEVTGVASYGSPLVARIGSSISNNKHFKGKIDELKVFDGSLIEPEILLLQNYTSCNNVYNDTYISTQSVSTAVICTGSAFVLEAFSNNITIDNGLQFLAELSDASGSFNNPTVVGGNTFLPISVTVPNNIAGGNYKLRIRYGGLVSVNSIDIYVNNPASYNITGTVAISDGQSSNLNLEFTGTGPWNYIMSNGLSGVATTSPWQITVDPDQSTTYSVSSAQNVCGNASLNGSSSATVSVNYTKEFITCLPFNGNALDSKSNNTTVLNGPILTSQRYGDQNKAYTFNGSNNYIEYTTNDLRKREFTMSAWVLVNALSGSNQYIISQGEVGTKTFQGLGVNNSGWFFQSYGNYGGYTASSNSGLATNQWVQLTAVRTYQSLKLYVNGELVRTTSNNAIIPFKSSDIGRIGANSSTLGNYFNGKIDDVRLFKGALNDEEVYALYTNNSDCPAVENTPIIVVRDVNPSTVCAGNTVSLYYSLSNVSASNMLRAELSDRYGSFTSPKVLGTGFTSSPISVAIPANTSESGEYDNYRIRLVSSGPSPLTSVNTQSIIVSGTLPTATVSGGSSIPFEGSATVNIDFTGTSPWTYALNNGASQSTSESPVSVSVSPYSTTTYTVTSVSNTCGAGTSSGSALVNVAPNITLGSIASVFCAGQTFNIPYTANFVASPNFRAELSDSNGDFSDPVTLGASSGSNISATIPNNSISGTSYKIRVVSESPSYVSPEFMDIRIKGKVEVVLAGSATIDAGESTNLTLNFTGDAPWTYAINNGSSQSTSISPLIISVSPYSTTTYTVTSVGNTCGAGSSSGSAVVNVAPNINLGSIANVFCAAQTFNIPFTANFTASPNFRAELSDSNGDFSNPVPIGTSLGSNIAVTLPNNSLSGTFYKIRIVSDSPSFVSPEFTNITIRAKVTASISGTNTIDEGESAELTLNFTGTAPFTYQISGNSSKSTNANQLVIPVYPLVNTGYTLSVSNICGNGMSTGNPFITVNPVVFRLVSCLPFNGNSNDSKGLNNAIAMGASLTMDRNGNVNKAYSFSDSNDRISLENVQGIRNFEYSFSLWFNTDASQPVNSRYLLLNLANNTFDIKKRAGGSYSFNYTGYSNFGVDSKEFILENYTPNVWHNVTFVRKLGEYLFYMDGVLVGTGEPPSNYYEAHYGPPYILKFGGNWYSTSMIGKIDDFQIYKGALNQGQISALYQNNDACFDATTYTCLSDNTLNTILNGQKVYQVSNQLIGSSSILSGSDIHFDSKNSVLLQPGFKTESNAVFSATVGGGCE